MQREAEREGLRDTAKAEAEMRAARSFAEAQKIAAEAAAEAEKIGALAAAERYEVDAAGARQLNEAENILSEPAPPAGCEKSCWSASKALCAKACRPLEKIEGIKMLHMDGVNGGNWLAAASLIGVINSALCCRVQAPMIDNLMKEMGIEGGSLGRMTDVLRDAAESISALTRDGKSGKAKPGKDERDRDG